MEYIYSFLFVGFLCMIGELILDNTKLTLGHITSIFVVLGAVLGFFGIYDRISLYVGSAASLPIMSFGNQLYNAAYTGLRLEGIMGIFSNMLTTTSAGISAAIIFSFLFAICFKPRN